MSLIIGKSRGILLVSFLVLCLPLVSEAGECLVLAGEPIFFTEPGIEECMDIMASLMDAEESFATGTRAYWDKVKQLVSRKEARILREDLAVRILDRKDYILGLVRLPGIKILALDPASGREVWVFIDSTECRQWSVSKRSIQI